MGINFSQYDNIRVSVRPPEGERDDPKYDIKPISSFKECEGLGPLVLANLAHEKFEIPTPVQKYALPILVARHDLIASAETGSGKTLAFLCPMIANLSSDGPVMRPFFPGKHATAFPRALVLAPTRELTQQIHAEAQKLVKNTTLVPRAIFGGDNLREQAKSLEQENTDILCATPGRLLDMVKACKVSLSFISYLFFDEGDKMLDMGFEKPMRDIVCKQDMPPREKRQTAMFSATFPGKIMKMVNDFMRPYMRLKVGATGSVTKNIRQVIKYVGQYEKNKEVMKDLANIRGRTIIFVERKRTCDGLCNFLCDKGQEAVSIHGKLDQWIREEALKSFKKGKARVMVATSVAARGLDVPKVEHVINYDFPSNIETYTHRIGRTGRAGFMGLATSYLNSAARSVIPKLIRLLRSANQDVPSFLSNMAGDRGRGRYRSSWGKSRGGYRRGDRDRGGARDKYNYGRRGYDDDRRNDRGRNDNDRFGGGRGYDSGRGYGNTGHSRGDYGNQDRYAPAQSYGSSSGGHYASRESYPSRTDPGNSSINQF